MLEQFCTPHAVWVSLCSDFVFDFYQKEEAMVGSASPFVRPCWAWVLVLAAWTASCLPAGAAVKNWTGASNTWWDDGANWSPTGQPVAGDGVYITTVSGDRTVDYWNTAHPWDTLSMLYLDATGSGNVWLNLTWADHPLYANTEYVGYNGHAIVNQSTGGHAPTNLYLGYSAGSKGTYNLSGGLLACGNETLGMNGVASFSQTGGTHTVTNTLNLAYNPNSTAGYGLSIGTLTAGYEIIGDDTNALASFTQWSGSNQVTNDLSLGNYQASSQGYYTLGDSGVLTVGGYLYVGKQGYGNLTHYGTSTIGTLCVGYSSGSRGEVFMDSGHMQATTIELRTGGTFNFSGGRLTANQVTQMGGAMVLGTDLLMDDGSGGANISTYKMSGGQILANGRDVRVGNSGTGTLIQTDGAISGVQTILLAYFAGSVGTYNLSGGSLSAVDLYLSGPSSTATVNHSNGNIVISRNLYVAGWSSGSNGTYNFSGGSLAVNNNEHVGTYGTGVFQQDGGTHTVAGTLFIAEGGRGTYNLANGSLTAATITLASGGTLDRTGGNLWCGNFYQNGGVHVEGPAGPFVIDGSEGIGSYTLNDGRLEVLHEERIGASASGAFAQYAGDHSVATQLYIGSGVGSAGTYYLGGGSLTTLDEEYAFRSGSSATFIQNGGTHTIRDNLMFPCHDTGSALYTLYSGALNVAGNISVGLYGSGTFNHLGGDVTITSSGTTYGLYVGYVSAARGWYEMQGGNLSVPNAAIIVGYSASTPNATVLNQSGGTVIAQYLYVGDSASSWGEYNLFNSGTLSATWQYIGNAGAGVFWQSGGSNTASFQLVGAAGGGIGQYNHSGGVNHVGYLHLGAVAGATGTYNLSDSGQLNVTWDEQVGRDGNGTFNQNGGTHTVGGLLYLAYDPSSQGIYNLSSGSLGAFGVVVGDDNGAVGAFTQGGGVHTVGVGGLYLASYVSSSRGTYTLNNGMLTVNGTEVVGSLGVGSFTQTGGTHTVNGDLIIGQFPGSNGTFTLGSATLTVTGSVHVGSGGVGTLAMGAGGGASSRVNPMTSSGMDPTIYIGSFGSGGLTFDAKARFAAESGSTIILRGGNFSIRGTSPAALAGLTNLTLAVEQNYSTPANIEVAGRDYGPVEAGFANNFAIGTLQVGWAWAGGISLVDAYLNQPAAGAPEALYVDNLVALVPCKIQLNGLHLYFRVGGVPKLLYPGDANLDGLVDQADYTIWYNHYGANSGWTEGDFSGDGLVDQADYTSWYNHYGAGGSSVPEPATLSLLVLGGLAMLRRRR